MDENPYRALQTKHAVPAAVRQRPMHSATRGAVIGAIVGGVPILVLTVIGVVLNYRGYAGNDNLPQYRIDMGNALVSGVFLSLGLAAVGALVGAALLGAVQWFELRGRR